MPSRFVDALINFLSAPPKYFEHPNADPVITGSGYPITPKYGDAKVIFHASTTFITPIPQALGRTASVSIKRKETESIPLVRLGLCTRENKPEYTG